MRILLTGQNGYIGAIMIPALLAEGHEIIGLDTGYFKGCTFGDYSVSVKTLRRDLRDVTSEDLQDIDAVVPWLSSTECLQ
jgi:nucleoside-diphosphate-sugar epimerase